MDNELDKNWQSHNPDCHILLKELTDLSEESKYPSLKVTIEKFKNFYVSTIFILECGVHIVVYNSVCDISLSSLDLLKISIQKKIESVVDRFGYKVKVKAK